MTIRLVALDIDGTIVGPDFTLPNELVATVHSLQARGVVVTLATGRMLRSTQRFAATLHIEGPVICYQGALTAEASTGRHIRHTGLSPAAVREALGLLAGFSGQVLLYLDDLIYGSKRTEWSDGYEERMGLRIEIVDALEPLAAKEPTLLLAVDSPDSVAQFADRLGRQMNGRALVTRSLPHFCEIASPRAGKAAALEELAISLGFEAPETLAFGDGSGDAEMLRWAGIGVAMEDGHADAIEAADMAISGPSGAGVAEYLRSLLEAGKFG